jgi:hypothetical protein
MLALIILAVWLVWLGVRWWLRRNDPRGLALLTGEEEVAASAPPTILAPPAPRPGFQAVPPAVGALQPRTQAAYGRIPGYDRRRIERRRFADRRAAARPTGDRRAGYDRRSA